MDNDKPYNVKFCVFLGREKNIKILHFYIELGLKENSIDEYLMFDFSRNISDHHFISFEYNRLFSKYPNRIFLFDNYSEIKSDKVNWNPFYKTIYEQSNDNDIIIKCDDDILFIDIYELKNAIQNRFQDKESFLIHSNCINNGVCAYYQSHLYPSMIENELKKYPKGGLLGVLFEKPEIALSIHYQFTNDLLQSFDTINKYIISDKYINTRISINFILINGCDTKYLKDISFDDEYQLSCFIPESLCRYNKIIGNFITSHLSYGFQNKVILKNNNIINLYNEIKNFYCKTNKIIVKPFETKLECCYFHNNIFKVKNWIHENHYYIKNVETNNYLYIDFEIDNLTMDSKKTMFEIYNVHESLIFIQLGIYYLTRYNCISNFRNPILLSNCFTFHNEKYIIKEFLNDTNNNQFYLKFLKYNNYLSIDGNNTSINVSNNKVSLWTFEKVIQTNDFLFMERIIKNNKIYYKNIETNEIYTNYYMGWGLENIFYNY